MYKFIETNTTISKHLDFWLSVNLFGLWYFSLNRDHFVLAFDNTCAKACMTKVTSRLEYTEVCIINVVSIVFNRNWPSMLYQDPTNAPTLRFKWNNPCAIITAILLHVSMHMLPILVSGQQIESKKNIRQWRKI